MTTGQRILLGFLLFLLLLICLLSIRHKTLTYDEPENWKYGIKLLALEPGREHAGVMPFSAFNAIPFRLGKLFGRGKIRDILSGGTAARFVTILFSLIVAAHVFSWARELYGARPAFFSLFLYIFSPNLLAHARLIHTDFYAAGMCTVSLYYFWRFLKFGGRRRALVSALVLGLSQLAKYNCLLLYPIFSLLLVARYSRGIAGCLRTGNFKALAGGTRAFLVFALFFLLIGLLIVNLGFFFNRSFTPLAAYSLRSDAFRSLQARLAGLGRLPLPLPYPYLEGIDWLQWKTESGAGFGYMCLFGQLKKTGGFRNYFLYAFLYKVPIALQLLFVLAAVHYLFHWRKYNFRENEVFLVLPVMALAFYFQLFVNVHLGIRYILAIFPLFIVFCGSFFKDWSIFSGKLKYFLVFLLLYQAGSVLSYFPHFLSYFNEFVWDRKQAYKIIADSNIDWGQNEWYLEQYRKKNPDVHVNPSSPVPGRIVVSVNDLVGVWAPGKYRWLRDYFVPVDHVAYSYLVFDISPDLFEERN